MKPTHSFTRLITTAATAASGATLAALLAFPAAAQSSPHPKLHVNPRWKECSFQIDPSLTQRAWHQFTQEAGLVAYFRPLEDAQPMGKGRFEVSMTQWQTNIDDADAAWNDTFVHPDSTHWLKEGAGLKFPGLMLRAGLTGRTDVGIYATKNPNANYGFYGGQIQQNVLGGTGAKWNASARASFVSLYGPEDLDFTVYGADLVASRRVALGSRMSLSPYAGVSAYVVRSHEKTTAVSLPDEHVGGVQAMVGAQLQVSVLRVAAEYSDARVPTLSLKVGIGR